MLRARQCLFDPINLSVSLATFAVYFVVVVVTIGLFGIITVLPVVEVLIFVLVPFRNGYFSIWSKIDVIVTVGRSTIWPTLSFAFHWADRFDRILTRCNIATKQIRDVPKKKSFFPTKPSLYSGEIALLNIDQLMIVFESFFNFTGIIGYARYNSVWVCPTQFSNWSK